MLSTGKAQRSTNKVTNARVTVGQTDRQPDRLVRLTKNTAVSLCSLAHLDARGMVGHVAVLGRANQQDMLKILKNWKKEKQMSHFTITTNGHSFNSNVNSKSSSKAGKLSKTEMKDREMKRFVGGGGGGGGG